MKVTFEGRAESDKDKYMVDIWGKANQEEERRMEKPFGGG
jgi:hypothetical protein